MKLQLRLYCDTCDVDLPVLVNSEGRIIKTGHSDTKCVGLNYLGFETRDTCPHGTCFCPVHAKDW